MWRAWSATRSGWASYRRIGEHQQCTLRTIRNLPIHDRENADAPHGAGSRWRRTRFGHTLTVSESPGPLSLRAGAKAVVPPSRGKSNMSSAAPVQLLVFALGSERFAVRAPLVAEVVRAVAVAALPDAPPVVEGAINHRGRIVAVVDVRRRLGLASPPLDPSQHFIVADAGPRRVALRVDSAMDLVAVTEDAIESAARATPGARYTEGIARLADGLIVIHDLERFLSLDEGREVDAALGTMEGVPETGGVP